MMLAFREEPEPRNIDWSINTLRQIATVLNMDADLRGGLILT